MWYWVCYYLSVSTPRSLWDILAPASYIQLVNAGTASSPSTLDCLGLLAEKRTLQTCLLLSQVTNIFYYRPDWKVFPQSPKCPIIYGLSWTFTTNIPDCENANKYLLRIKWHIQLWDYKTVKDISPLDWGYTSFMNNTLSRTLVSIKH